MNSLFNTVEARQAVLSVNAEGTVEVRFKPGITLDKAGLDDVITQREQLAAQLGPHAVLVVFPPDGDFEIAVMTTDHYNGREALASTRAMAIAANSVMHERMASLYFAYFPQPFKASVFVEEADARRWLQGRVQQVA